jgi:hypothetical protein
MNQALATDEFSPKENSLLADKSQATYLDLKEFGFTFDDCITIDSYEKWASSRELLEKSEVLGLDTETIPSFIKWEPERTALLQVANGTKIFLFDFLSKTWDPVRFCL